MADTLPNDYPSRFAAWTKLMDSGNQAAADSYYFEHVLPAILPLARERSGALPAYSGLISLLGFTPETTVVAYLMLRPTTLVVLHTPETAKFLDIVQNRTGVPLQDFHHESFLHDDEHTDDIFAALSKAIARFGPRDAIAIEMTGGKKTMGVQLATAVASLRHMANRNVDIVYIDYDEYLPRYRKPSPESTRLIVLADLPETAAAIFRQAAEKTSAVREILVSPFFEGRGFPIDEKLVFVLMPFTQPWSHRVWKHIQDICQRLGLRVQRADDLSGSKIIEDVWQGICQARVVVADLTARNPNVFYELGLAHTLGKRFVLLTQDIDDVPFDLQHFRCVLYADNVEGFEQLTEGLSRMLRQRV